MLKLAFVAGLVPIVVGCSKSSSSSSDINAFSQWSAIQPGNTVQATGFSVQRTYVTDKDGNYQIVGGWNQAATGATYTSVYDSAGNVSLITINASTGYTFTFDKSQGDTIVNSSGLVGSYFVATNAAGTNMGLFANAPANGWDYQSFGVWVTGQGLGAGTVGAVSYGNPTTTLPTVGTASFNGLYTGVVVLGPNTAGYATGTMNAAVDFGAQTVGLSTANTVVTNSLVTKNITSVTAAPQLNIAGVLTFNGINTQFSGAIVNNAGWSGNAQGQLYGPNAQEIGGTFAITGTGVQTMTAAFGGKR